MSRQNAILSIKQREKDQEPVLSQFIVGETEQREGWHCVPWVYGLIIEEFLK
jgi:hypothetical protein